MILKTVENCIISYRSQVTIFLCHDYDLDHILFISKYRWFIFGWRFISGLLLIFDTLAGALARNERFDQRVVPYRLVGPV